jgi:hypothetical protein
MYIARWDGVRCQVQRLEGMVAHKRSSPLIARLMRTDAPAQIPRQLTLTEVRAYLHSAGIEYYCWSGGYGAGVMRDKSHGREELRHKCDGAGLKFLSQRACARRAEAVLSHRQSCV